MNTHQMLTKFHHSPNYSQLAKTVSKYAKGKTVEEVQLSRLQCKHQNR